MGRIAKKERPGMTPEISGDRVAYPLFQGEMGGSIFPLTYGSIMVY